MEQQPDIWNESNGSHCVRAHNWRGFHSSHWCHLLPQGASPGSRTTTLWRKDTALKVWASRPPFFSKPSTCQNQLFLQWDLPFCAYSCATGYFSLYFWRDRNRVKFPIRVCRTLFILEPRPGQSMRFTTLLYVPEGPTNLLCPVTAW